MAPGRTAGGGEGLCDPPPVALVHFAELGLGLEEVEAVVRQETGGERMRVGGGAGEPQFCSLTSGEQGPPSTPISRWGGH